MLVQQFFCLWKERHWMEWTCGHAWRNANLERPHRWGVNHFTGSDDHSLNRVLGNGWWKGMAESWDGIRASKVSTLREFKVLNGRGNRSVNIKTCFHPCLPETCEDIGLHEWKGKCWKIGKISTYNNNSIVRFPCLCLQIHQTVVWFDARVG